MLDFFSDYLSPQLTSISEFSCTNFVYNKYIIYQKFNTCEGTRNERTLPPAVLLVPFVTCDLLTILAGLAVGGLTWIVSGVGVLNSGCFSGLFTGDRTGDFVGDFTGDLIVSLGMGF